MVEKHQGIGFTGTSKGTTARQDVRLAELLCSMRDGTPWQWLHHGDCVGADERAHQLALMYGMNCCIHPPTNPAKRGWMERTIGPGDVEVREPQPYLARNRAIVDATTILVACPVGMEEVLRSGTWATVRYARRLGRPVTIVYPDGSIVETF